MIVIDTNVVSEMFRRDGDPLVVRWFDEQNRDALWLTAVTAAELLFGVAKMPEGARRTRLADLVGEVLEREFVDRVLPFDVRCAPHFATFLASRRAAGRPVSHTDAQIVAIALAHGADALATRNTKDFEGSGLHVINPWQD